MADSSFQRIGIIGGSYNPVHIAHLIIADRFAEQMQLDKTYLVPAYRSPFKLDEDSHEIASPQQRCTMLRLALEYYPQFEVDTVEVDRAGVSYTIDTIRYFQHKFPGAELYLLIGSDQALAFTKWKDWQDILHCVHLCIARRPHIPSPEVERALTFNLSTDPEEPQWINAPQMAISSTEIRQRVTEGHSIKFVVPWKVEQYIYEHELYRK